MKESLFKKPYPDPVVILREVYENKQKRNPRYSIRSWARDLGLAGSTFLHQILEGRRPLTLKIAAKVAAKLELNEDETEFFLGLCLLKRADDPFERKLLEVHLDHLVLVRDFREAPLLTGELDIKWYHLYLMASLDLPDFRLDPDYLARRVGNGLDAPTIRQAFLEMAQAGWVGFDSQGRPLMRERRLRIRSFGGEYRPGHPVYERQAAAVNAGLRALGELPKEDRIHSAQYATILKKDVAKFRTELCETVNSVMLRYAERAEKTRGEQEIFLTTLQVHKMTPPSP